MDTQTLNEEKQHLANTLTKIIESKTYLEKSIDALGSNTLETLKELKESSQSGDLEDFMARMSAEHSAYNIYDKYTQLSEFESMIQQPYFARIDVTDVSNENSTSLSAITSHYIGKFGFSYNTQPTILDWRAKVASIYYRYRYPQKNVKYDTPDGEVTKDLKLKRTYEIDNSELVKYYNNDIQFDESAVISEKISTRTGGVLEDIVETIQEKQLDIIESDPRRVCIVQGCVGSGKSTVAIHKLSHIFFNFPQLIKPERALLVAKNQILIGYLSTLFPKLGIFNISYKTLRDLIINIIFREKIRVSVDLDLDQDTSQIDMTYLDNLQKLVDSVAIKIDNEIKDLFSDPEYAAFSGAKYSYNQTPYENISDIISDIEEELDMQKENLKENPESLRAWLFKDNIKVLRKLITKLKKLQTSIEEDYMTSLVKQLKINTKEKLGYKDILLYISLHIGIIGFKDFMKYEYCVVDEGQDFSLLEYQVLGNLIVNGRFSILGDLNQGYKEEGIASWDDIQKVIKAAKEADVFELDTNYRSTKPIIDFANSILGKYTQTYLPKPINRNGADPEIIRTNSSAELLTKFEQAISADAQDLNKSIGIIVYDTSLMEDVNTIVNKLDIQKDLLIKLNAKTRIIYHPKAIYLTDFDDCKGLEFSKVYVLGLNVDAIKTRKEAKSAFVAVTRAMSQLSVYY